MAQLDNTGPEGRGAGTGRGLGFCKNHRQSEQSAQIGKGCGSRRKSGGGIGKGKRNKSHLV